MKSNLSLPAELMGMSFVLIDILKAECKASTGVNAPTHTQFRILYAIQDGAKQVGKISEAFGISQPAASKMVDHMVNEGWLKRSPHPKDRRQIELHLTTKAHSSFDKLHKRYQKKIGELLSKFSTVKKNTLAKEIHQLREVLSKNELGNSMKGCAR